jgi:hypothetical protein
MDPLLDFTSTEWGALCDLVRRLESSFEALQTGLVYCVIAARFITGDYKTREPGCITKMLIDL